MPAALHLDLDGAWPEGALSLPAIELREWGRRLRFSAPPRLIEKFYREHGARLAPFILYGSGDFHHLSGLWTRRANEARVLVSFDNHPDWDVRPPKWCCGAWINRALELPQMQKGSVWGCGNFEYWWPRRLFGNRRAERAGRLEIHPWADDRLEQDRQLPNAILRSNWRDKFETFARGLGGANIYVTIDLDCLRAEEAVTNWENGRFEIVDLVWALGKLRESARIVAGDICGGYSVPKYARWKQKFASEMDHPKLAPPDFGTTQEINLAAIETLWPVLTQ